jgi:carboxyl-terminal processing protease
MEDGSLLKLTIAKWYTPKDYSIDHNGIDPDIKVSFLREDFENKYDRQKETAKKVLKDFIKYDNIALTVEKNIQTAS